MPAVRDRQRTCPKRRANPGGGDGRLPEARRDHGRAVRQAPARYRQAARPGRGIDDDRRVDHVTDRDRPGVVGGDTQGGREELVRWLTSSARGNSSPILKALLCNKLLLGELAIPVFCTHHTQTPIRPKPNTRVTSRQLVCPIS